MSRIICYVAGKSGGHIIPALTHAQKSKEDSPDVKVLFFSTDSPLDRSLLEKHPLVDQYQPLTLANVPRKNILAWPRFVAQFFVVMGQVFTLLRRHRPSKVVSTGGYIGLPVCMIAKILRIPVELYVLDVVPGEAAKLLSRWADVTHLAFAQTAKYLPKSAHCVETPYPLRYKEVDRIAREQACERLGIDQHKKIVCVLGGSQGSHFINDLLQRWVSENSYAKDCIIVHQTGLQGVEQVQQFYQRYGITAFVFAYRNDINLCYAAADVIVARAGAGTLFEILFFKKQAIIVPLETVTTAHQKDNALMMQTNHPQFFSVLLQKDVSDKNIIFFKKMADICQKSTYPL